MTRWNNSKMQATLITSYKFRNALLIDDNHIDNMINKRILLNHDIAENIHVSISGAEALHYLDEHQNDPDLFPDLIFLDIRMPEMDGFQFLDAYEQLQTPLKSSTIIYMLSSSLDPTDQRKVAENKYVFKFMGKPLSQSHLQTLLNEKKPD